MPLALNGANLTLELKGLADKAHGDRAGTGAADKDGAVAEDASHERLGDIDGLDFAHDHLVGVSTQQAVSVEETTVAQKDGCGQVADQFSQVEIGKPVEFWAVNYILALGQDIVNVHLFSDLRFEV